MKNILILSTSLRANSNSAALADAFAKGAASVGHTVETVSLAGKNIGFCRGCLACGKLHKCVINDDAPEITEKMRLADVIVFATPIYYYEMSGQMKTMLDRANSMYSMEYNFRDIYLLASAADEDEHAIDRAVTGLGGWIECFEKARLAGTLLAAGVNDAGELKKAPQGDQLLQKAYQMGAAL